MEHVCQACLCVCECVKIGVGLWGVPISSRTGVLGVGQEHLVHQEVASSSLLPHRHCKGDRVGRMRKSLRCGLRGTCGEAGEPRRVIGSC